ncbi:MAG: hypothetical protein ACFFD4_26460, partial [Candidatus Odinarchaeota archaeon]
MTIDETDPDSTQKGTDLKEILITQQKQINTLHKQITTLNNRIAEILEDKVSRIDRTIQLQLEKFLARVKLQNDRLRERLKDLEDFAPVKQSSESVIREIGLSEQKAIYALLKEHETSITDLETNIKSLEMERKKLMADFTARFEWFVRKVDGALQEVQIREQESLQEQFKKFSDDIDEKLALISHGTNSEPDKGGHSTVVDDTHVRLDRLTEKLGNIEKEGIKSSIDLNLNFSDRLSEIERRLEELAAGRSVSDLPIESDTKETKLKFYETMVTDLTDQLQEAIKKTSELSEEIDARKGQETELTDLRSAYEKMRSALSSIQLEHETL